MGNPHRSGSPQRCGSAQAFDGKVLKYHGAGDVLAISVSPNHCRQTEQSIRAAKSGRG